MMSLFWISLRYWKLTNKFVHSRSSCQCTPCITVQSVSALTSKLVRPFHLVPSVLRTLSELYLEFQGCCLLFNYQSSLFCLSDSFNRLSYKPSFVNSFFNLFFAVSPTTSIWYHWAFSLSTLFWYHFYFFRLFFTITRIESRKIHHVSVMDFYNTTSITQCQDNKPYFCIFRVYPTYLKIVAIFIT